MDIAFRLMFVQTILGIHGYTFPFTYGLPSSSFVHFFSLFLSIFFLVYSVPLALFALCFPFFD